MTRIATALFTLKEHFSNKFVKQGNGGWPINLSTLIDDFNTTEKQICFQKIRERYKVKITKHGIYILGVKAKRRKKTNGKKR